MNERTALLQAIVDNPLEHTPRLMYADWLDENGTTPVEAKTVEFIRMSCKGSPNAMPRKVYPWIKKNWGKLIPTVLKSHVGGDQGMWGPMKCPAHLWKGGTRLRLKINIAGHLRSGAIRVYTTGFQIRYWKGFVCSLVMNSDWGRRKLMPLLAIDQPLLLLIVNQPASQPPSSRTPDPVSSPET